MHEYSYFSPLSSLKRAVVSARPDLIIPGDDLATQRLHELYWREEQRNGRQSTLCGLIERSLGSPDSFPIVYERASFMRLAEEAGVRVPKTVPVPDSDDLRQWAIQVKFPFVLKADGSSGGEGVRVVRTVEEAQRAFRKLHAPPLLARAAKRALFDGDATLLFPSLLRRRPVVSVQRFVEGREANSTIACWNGAVLAALHFEVVNKMHSTGHATVIKIIDHPEMTGAVETMVARLKLSGVHGFDFVLEENTGHAYLIEVNPRSTQVGHLTLGPGHDLSAALVAAITRGPVRAGSKMTENNTIALFPQEWTRDPASPFLQSAYHDVPWEEPELVWACVERARKQNRSIKPRDWDLAVAHLMRFAPQEAATRTVSGGPKIE
jgi:acetyl/propionyl-CoA carboxylase alpha subunit